MLTILYIISVVSCFMASIYDKNEEHKKYRKSFIISMISGLLYAIPIVCKTFTNLFNPNFSYIFGLSSLLIWHIVIITESYENLIPYMFSVFLGSSILSFVLSNFYYSSYLQFCEENHDYTERINIVTTVDGTEFGESIFGEGYTVARIYQSNPNVYVYKYYYMDDDGNIKHRSVYNRRTEVTFIDEDDEPCIEISYFIKCRGYKKDSGEHFFKDTHSTYHLYLPKGSVVDIYPKSD